MSEPSKSTLLDELESDWRAWNYYFFEQYLRSADGKPTRFAPHHSDFWTAFWTIRRGRLPRIAGASRNSIFCVWPRGHGKSTSIESAVVSAACRRTRKYALYVSASQDQADGHVANIASMLTDSRVGQFYPDVAERRIGKHGQATGWRRNRLQTASGFTIDAVGLDKGIRGVRDEEQRPDLIILDDIDDINDSGTLTDRKMRTLSRSIIPTGSTDCVIVMVQNLVLEDGIMDRLIHGRADFLRGAYVSGPHPAVNGLVYEGQPDGTWRIVGGTPTWDGFPISACEATMNKVGPGAFLAEYQHELSGVSDRVHPNFQPGTHAFLKAEIPPFVAMVGGLDFGGEGRTANETAGLLAGIEENGRILLVDEFKDNGANVDERLYAWMRIQEEKWQGPGSIIWHADGTESLGIRAMRRAGFTVFPSRLGGRIPLREFRIRQVGHRLALDGAGFPGLRYLPRLRKWEAEMLRYRRQKPAFDGDPRRREVITVDDHLMTATEYLVDGIDGPHAVERGANPAPLTVTV